MRPCQLPRLVWYQVPFTPSVWATASGPRSPTVPGLMVLAVNQGRREACSDLRGLGCPALTRTFSWWPAADSPSLGGPT